MFETQGNPNIWSERQRGGDLREKNDLESILKFCCLTAGGEGLMLSFIILTTLDV